MHFMAISRLIAVAAAMAELSWTTILNTHNLGHLQNMHQLQVLQMEDSDGICVIGLLVGVLVGVEGAGLEGFGDGEGLGAGAAGVLPPGTTRLRLSAMTLRSFCAEDDSKYLLTPASIRAFLTSSAEAVGRSCK